MGKVPMNFFSFRSDLIKGLRKEEKAVKSLVEHAAVNFSLLHNIKSVEIAFPGLLGLLFHRIKVSLGQICHSLLFRDKGSG